MLLFIPRSLCALKRVAAKADHPRFAATQGIRIAVACGMYRAEATDGRRAVVVQGMVPTEEPPWPAFKELPDDAFEAIILPKDLERACKVGDDQLRILVDEVRRLLTGQDITRRRKDQGLRKLVQEQMQSVKVVLDTLVEDAPLRQIVLRD